MTTENEKKNIAEELGRSGVCLEEAGVLRKEGLYSGAVSRMYYAVLHGVRALLLSKGLEPKSHEGALRLLSMHFVKEGGMDREVWRIFARLMKFREEADYNASFDFAEKDCVEFGREADLLLANIKEYLGKQNLL